MGSLAFGEAATRPIDARMKSAAGCMLVEVVLLEVKASKIGPVMGILSEIEAVCGVLLRSKRQDILKLPWSTAMDLTISLLCCSYARRISIVLRQEPQAKPSA